MRWRWFRRIALIVISLVLVFVVGLLALAWPSSENNLVEFGVTFSQPHATGIGLDWRETYDAILDDLGVKKLRLSAYWNEVEPKDDVFDFKDMDYQMDRAAEAEAKVLLGVGRKLPRWPECHTPEWALELSEAEQQEEVLEMVEVVVKRYKDHPALERWQVENEPLHAFGICPEEDPEFLGKEIDLIKSIDSNHLTLVTDSGELSLWLDAAKFGDILGTTMYRTVLSKRTKDYFSYDYIFPTWAYRAKARLVGLVRGKPVLISELQGEPWGGDVSFIELPREVRDKSFSVERMEDLTDFANRTQLGEAYWWGVEYWYWVKEVEGDPVFWDKAREVF